MLPNLGVDCHDSISRSVSIDSSQPSGKHSKKVTIKVDVGYNEGEKQPKMIVTKNKPDQMVGFG